jgi:hypothetical protein
LLVEEVHGDLDHDACCNSREHSVVINADPVVPPRRSAKVIDSDIRDNVNGRPEPDGQPVPTMPVMHVVAVGPPILSGLEPLVVPVLVVIARLRVAILVTAVIVAPIVVIAVSMIIVMPFVVIAVAVPAIARRVGERQGARQQ